MTSSPPRYSKRETETLEALYRIGSGSVSDIADALPEPRAYEAVRTTLRVLERKGAIKHRSEDRRFIYSPVMADSRAWKSNARNLARVFFGGSIEDAALAMLKISDVELSEADLRQLEQRIAEAKRKGGKP